MKHKEIKESRKEPYKVPTDYFKRKSEEWKTLQNITEGSKHESPYALPENYFAQSKLEIKERVLQDEGNVRHLWLRIVSAAAVFVLLFAFLPLIGDKSNETAKVEFADLTDDELLTYIDYIDEEIDLNLLIDEDFIDETVLDKVYEETADSKDYLLDNLEDIELLELEELL